MNWLPLLLADPSPCLRYLVLRDLFKQPDDDPEVVELQSLREADPLVSSLLALQEPSGFWTHGDGSWPPHLSNLRGTTLALARLGYLGFGSDHPAVRRGVEALCSLQREDGAWPISSGDEDEAGEGYSMIPLQTALPLRALALCGYATDPRAEKGYVWLLDQRLDDGVWPTGLAAGTLGRVAGYRRLPHSRWGCRANTTAALISLAYHPTRRTSPAAKGALDLLLGRDTQEAYTLGFEVARLIGQEAARGFITFYARFDLGVILDLCRRIGASLEDRRVAQAVGFVNDLQGPYGLWAYPPQPQTSRWVTFDLLRSLSELDPAGEWFSLAPPTPFQTYARQLRRY